MRRSIAAFGCLLLSLLAPGRAAALDPDVALSQYAYRNWDLEQGLPRRDITSIVQTPDGYLWIGSAGGLSRFDGDRFVTFDRSNTPAFRRDWVRSMCVSRDGAVWAGTSDGILTYVAGSFAHVDVTYDGASRSVRSILCANDGTVYAGTGGAGLFVVRAGSAARHPAWSGQSTVTALAELADGTVLVGTFGDGLFACRGDACETIVPVAALADRRITALRVDADGTIWVGLYAGGLFRLDGGTMAPAPFARELPEGPIWALRRDADGNLWIAVHSGALARWAGGRLDVFHQSAARAIANPYALYEDLDRVLWIGSSATGLHRLKNADVRNFGEPEGLARDMVWTVLADPGGAVWVGTEGGGLGRIDAQGIAMFSLDADPRASRISSLARTADGTLWIGTRGAGVYRYDGRVFQSTASEPDAPRELVPALFVDSLGRLWAGGLGGAVHVLADGSWRALDRDDGYEGHNAWVFGEGPAGVIWIGTSGMGLYRYAEGRFTHFGPRQGVDAPGILAIHATPDGTVWFSAQGGGLYKLDGEHAIAVGRRSGVPSDDIYAIVAHERDFWLSTPVGIFRVAQRALDDVAAGRLAVAPVQRFGADDGMRSVECNGSAQPAAARGPDGVLWFATTAGVARLDPRRLSSNARAPAALIEGMQADGVDMDLTRPVELASATKRVAVKFTATSFGVPDQIRFRYRLDGLDEQWIEAVDVRRAEFAGLRPGRYRFDVLAANEDGVWGDAVSGPEFTIAAPFTERPSFYALLLAVAALLGVAYHRYRVLALRATTAALTERNRIARDLHDTVGQDLAGIAMQLQAAKRAHDIAPHRVTQLLEQADLRLRQSMEDTRRAIWALRPVELGNADFVTSLSNAVLAFANEATRVEVRTSGNPRRFDPALEANLLRLTVEAVRNAVVHANAAVVGVDLDFAPLRTRLTIADDGRGIDAKPEPGHGLGMALIRERAKLMRARVEISSRRGHGTRVTVALRHLPSLPWPRRAGLAT